MEAGTGGQWNPRKTSLFGLLWLMWWHLSYLEVRPHDLQIKHFSFNSFVDLLFSPWCIHVFCSKFWMFAPFMPLGSDRLKLWGLLRSCLGILVKICLETVGICWGDKATVMVEGNGYLWKNTDNYGKWWATETPQEITCNQKEWIWLDAWIVSAAMSFSVSIVVQQDWCDVCSSWRIKCLNVPWGLQHSAELQRHSGQPRRFVPNKEGVGHNGKASRAKCTKCACHDKVIETRGLWRKTWY